MDLELTPNELLMRFGVVSAQRDQLQEVVARQQAIILELQSKLEPPDPNTNGTDAQLSETS